MTQRDLFEQMAAPEMIAKLQDEPRADSARFSDDGVYRYELTRELGGDLTLVSIGLNPSIADAKRNDPTLRKDVGYAKLWGFGRLLKLNANAYKATDPKEMKRAAKAGIDIVGPDNDRTIRDAVGLIGATAGRVVVSWGANITPERQREMAELIRGVETWCFGINKDGSPVHELYQHWHQPLVRWSCP